MVLINVAPESGFQETYLATLKFSLDANKSMSNGPQSASIFSNTSKARNHSVDSLIFLDSVSASPF